MISFQNFLGNFVGNSLAISNVLGNQVTMTLGISLAIRLKPIRKFLKNHSTNFIVIFKLFQILRRLHMAIILPFFPANWSIFLPNWGFPRSFWNFFFFCFLFLLFSQFYFWNSSEITWKISSVMRLVINSPVPLGIFSKIEISLAILLELPQ